MGRTSPPENVSALSCSVSGIGALGHRLRQNTLRNFAQWISLHRGAAARGTFCSDAPRHRCGGAGLYVVVMSMFFSMPRATTWARSLPQGVRDVFEHITNFGLSGWFLFPFGFVLLASGGADLAEAAAHDAGRA